MYFNSWRSRGGNFHMTLPKIPLGIAIKGVNSVPYRQYRTVPTSKPVHINPLFRTGKNIGRTGQFRAIPADTGRTGRYKKKFVFFNFFLRFVIFEFLLGQNDNLFTLTY